ncbi:HTH-type transcriptional regulator, cell division transcriptional repressor [Vibrio crassostreae]|uniref:helix-turn-helix transcriptional regulator n=2 Tax=Vibrio crassostreae TaxID=246167 RepID=UPI00104CED78|nr:helix-turn-helix transcriptional regulator [Vibrio crassostreae]TCT61116.1 DNA-binding XRE family transcriptional regulator [Vibrio crassostreae]TCT61126.1 DNA-binding XRE family transcriptional regulator [Vibrio crassostreae]TCT82583.1 DNA-binding XRE family transcriptional regulator [Vibrio crassostreae]TCT82593.1 DNA-binding XRE family transcriptional regulator [Vibrio crassostreae]TCT94851.1 DNA-binding XRE family transcriptional regulator [Vibrio crassostreae]
MMSNIIKELRENKGLRQEDMAKMMGVAQQTILKWESGKTEPKASQILKLAKTLGVSVSVIFEEEESSIDKETENKIKEAHKLNEDEKKCLNMFIEAMLIRHYSRNVRIQ